VGALIGDLLPLAVGVAISPVPVIAAVLMLLARSAGGASLGMLIGWVAGITAATVVFALITGGADADGGRPPAAVGWIKILLGVLLLLLAAGQWRHRPRPGVPVGLPKWMLGIDSFTFPRALGLGFLLAAVNPKNLVLCVAAGVALGSADVSGGGAVLADAIFVLLASSTVALPVIAYAVAGDRMRRPLEELRAWLEANNATVMAVLLLVLGVVLIGRGIATV